MTPLPRRTVQPQPGLDLIVQEGGKGSPVLVLHGAPGPASLTPLTDHLCLSHRVVAPTHPGWDDSVRPETLNSVTALAAVYLDLLDQLDLKDVTVLGTSFGGWATAEVALGDRTGRISRLVLMDAIGPEVPGQPITVPGGPPPAIPSPTGGSTAPSRGGPPPQVIATMRAYTGAEMQDTSLLSRLSAITCPVLVLWGENDQVATPAYGRAYADAFPHAQFDLIPGAGHLPLREEPAAVFASLDRFLMPSAETVHD